MPNNGLINGVLINGVGGPETYQLSLTIEAEITKTAYQLWATIEARIYDPVGQLSATLEVEITDADVYQLAAGLEAQIYAEAQFAAAIEAEIYGATDSGYWSLQVLLGGVDVTDQVTGVVQIESEENESAICEFTLIPAAGAFDPMAWLGDVVEVDYIDLDASGSENWRRRRFTGRIIDPPYDVERRAVRFRAASDLQHKLEQMPRAEIDTLIGGYWSPHVFNAGADGWQYARDRISTREASLWVDPNGSPRVTGWSSGAGLSFGDADIIDGTQRLERATRRELVNRVVIKADFRFQRLRHREVRFNLQRTGSWCEFLTAPFVLPTREIIRSAAESTGWRLLNISYTDLPPAGVYYCGRYGGGGAPAPIVWGVTVLAGGLSIPSRSHGLLCQGARFKLAKRWAQTVTEQYSLDVRADQSIEYSGEQGVEESYGLEAEQDVSQWELSLDYSGPAGGATEAGNKDYTLDAVQGERDGRAAFDDLQKTVVAKARAEIIGSHRKNRVVFQTPFRADLALMAEASIAASKISAEGQVVRLVDILDTETGDARSEVSLAVKRHGGVGAVTDSPIAPVAPPATAVEAEHDDFIYLPFRIGGKTGSTPFDKNWTGFITNYQHDDEYVHPLAGHPNNPQTVIYPQQMIVEAPAIEDEARNEKIGIAAQVFDVEIVQDPLTLAA